MQKISRKIALDAVKKHNITTAKKKTADIFKNLKEKNAEVDHSLITIYASAKEHKVALTKKVGKKRVLKTKSELEADIKKKQNQKPKARARKRRAVKK